MIGFTGITEIKLPIAMSPGKVIENISHKKSENAHQTTHLLYSLPLLNLCLQYSWGPKSTVHGPLDVKTALDVAEN